MFYGLLENLWHWGGIPAGFAVIFCLDARKSDDKTAMEGWAIGASIVPVGLLLLYIAGGRWWEWIVFIASAIAGAAAAYAYLRFQPEITNSFAQRWTKRTKIQRNTRTDVREMAEHLPKIIDGFDPEVFFDKEKGIFIGRDESGGSLFIDRKTWPKLPHMMVAGASGTGKGVSLGVMAAQWLLSGEAVFFMDPKDDEFGPHVMAHAAEKAGVTHHFINLRKKIPQMNLFDGASSDEIEELFISGFALTDTGTTADFYSIADREWAAEIAKRMVAEGLTAKQAHQKWGVELKQECEKFAGKLRELAEVEAVNAAPGTGISFAEVIQNGGSCYIVGHMRDTKITRVQKMILVRILQIAETRDRLGDAVVRPIGVILDEFKYHISRSALEGLGAARDKGVHVTLAFQSLSDLYDCGALPGEAVEGAVVDNCKIKLVYKIESPETAEWLAKFSGKILVDDESREVSKNLALSEHMGHDRKIKMAERFLMDENILQNLQKGVAIIYGLGIAKFGFICPIRAKKESENILTTEATEKIKSTISEIQSTISKEKQEIKITENNISGDVVEKKKRKPKNI